MIDFTLAKEVLNNYSGSEVKKTIIYNNKKYLVKFPDPIREKNKNISYINNAYSEYVGSNIFSLCGFNTQSTILGLYYYHDKEKVVCACLDFTDEIHELYEFENLALSINPDKKIGTDFLDILEVLKNIYDDDKMLFKFLDMFIIDAFIGNTDRHNGNWGFMYNKKDGTMEFAPIYDNGSCLNPIFEDSEIEKLDNIEFKNIAYNVYSCLKIDNKKIHYFDFIKSMNNSLCNDALIRVFPNIDIDKIVDFINNIEGMSNVRKKFYSDVLSFRYQELEKVYYKLKEAMT